MQPLGEPPVLGGDGRVTVPGVVSLLAGEPAQLLVEQPLARPLPGLAAAGVDGGDAARQQRALQAAERALAAIAVVADQQRVQRHQELGLRRGHARRVRDVPGVQNRPVAPGAEVDRARVGDQRDQLLVMAGVPGRAALVLRRGAIDQITGRAAREVALASSALTATVLPDPELPVTRQTWVR